MTKIFFFILHLRKYVAVWNSVIMNIIKCVACLVWASRDWQPSLYSIGIAWSIQGLQTQRVCLQGCCLGMQDRYSSINTVSLHVTSLHLNGSQSFKSCYKVNPFVILQYARKQNFNILMFYVEGTPSNYFNSLWVW